MADSAQLDLKLLTFEFLFRAAPPPSKNAFDAFQKNHQNAWLKQFRIDFAAGFNPQDIQAAVTRTAADFAHLEDTLKDGRAYLSGDTFSLSDVAWMPNVHRFSLMDYPFEKTPNLKAWFTRITARASYASALLDWQNEHAVGAFGAYTAKRRAAGTDIRAYLNHDHE